MMIADVRLLCILGIPQPANMLTCSGFSRTSGTGGLSDIVSTLDTWEEVRRMGKFDATYFKKQKQRFWRKFWLEFVLCVMTVFYFGIPASLQELLFRILQTTLAALCGAAMYACLAVVRSLTEEEEIQQAIEHLQNERNSQ